MRPCCLFQFDPSAFNITAGLRFFTHNYCLHVMSIWPPLFHKEQLEKTGQAVFSHVCVCVCVWSYSTARVLLRAPFSVERQAEYSQRGANFRFQFPVFRLIQEQERVWRDRAGFLRISLSTRDLLGQFLPEWCSTRRAAGTDVTAAIDLSQDEMRNMTSSSCRLESWWE